MTRPTPRLLALAAAIFCLGLALALYPAWRPAATGESQATPTVVGPLLQGSLVHFRFAAPTPVLLGLDVRLATYARTNPSTLTLKLRRAGSPKPLAKGSLKAAGVVDWGYAEWRFSPVKVRPGEELLLTLTSPDATAETCLALLAIPARPGDLGLVQDGRAIAGALPVRVMVGVRVWPWQSGWVWLGGLIGLLAAWLLWPPRAKPVSLIPAQPEVNRRRVCLAAVGLTLAASLLCGWPNLVEKRWTEAAGFVHWPYPGDENWYAEMAHRMGLGERVLRGDQQVFELAEVINPYLGVVLPMGLLGLGDRVLGGRMLGYVIDFALPAGMVLALFLGAVGLGAGLGQAAVMALSLPAFPVLASFYVAGADSWAEFWAGLRPWLGPGTYFTSMGHPQMSGFLAVLAGLGYWAGLARGGRWLLLGGLGLGAMFYNDLYFQHIMIGSAGLFALATLLRRDWPMFRRAAASLGLALLAGLPYWINTYFFNRQPWAKDWLFEVVDQTPPWSWQLQRFEVNCLWAVAVLTMLYVAIILRRRRSPGLRATAPDWTVDLTFAPAWAFAVVFLADQVTGVNPQKHHYLWRGLAMVLAVAGPGWLWWWLSRRLTGRAGRVVLAGLTILILGLGLVKLANLEALAGGRPFAGRPPHLSAIRPGMAEALEYLKKHATPQDVVLTLDYEQIRWVGAQTPCLTYVPTLYNSLVLSPEKADRLAWAFALSGAKVSPSDYLDYAVNGPQVPGDPARSDYLAKSFGDFLVAVWAPLGPRYHLTVGQAIAQAGRRWAEIRSPQPRPSRSPYKFDYVLLGPLEKRLGAGLPGEAYRLLLANPDAELYAVVK